MVGRVLETAVEKLTSGVVVGNFTVYAKTVSRGRFREEVNLDVYLKEDELETRLLVIKIFYGRLPYHTPWVELSDISSLVNLGGKTIEYFDSIFEDNLLSIFSQAIKPGASIFIEYFEDEETRRQLGAGLPPPVSRLGYKLFKLGFTWFKDWYFAEGFWEGRQKLQGEKPNDESRIRQFKQIYIEVEAFLEKEQSLGEHEWYAVRAVVRAKNIINQLKEIITPKNNEK
ncbi:MAG: DUF1122 family protein [Candidatus Freyarchaeum deiterrae]